MKAVATATIKKPRTLLFAADDDSVEEEKIVVKKPRTLLFAADLSEDDAEEEEEEEEKPKKSKKPVEEKKKKTATPLPKTKKAVTKTKEAEEEDESEEKEKKARSEKVLGLEEVVKLLEILHIACSSKVLKSLEKNDKKRYAKLIALLELLTIAYSERTPVGRIFTYTPDTTIASDDGSDDVTPGFAVIRDSPCVFKLEGYEKKQMLNVRSVFDALGDEEKEKVFASLGLTKEPAKPLAEAKLFYGLIACDVITRVQADHSDPCQKCVLYDEKLKETHWLASKEAKAKLGPVFVLKLRKKVTEQNIIEETYKMNQRRDDIIALLASLNGKEEKDTKKKDKKEKKTASPTPVANPKKRKAPEPEEEEETKEASLPAKKKPRTPPTPKPTPSKAVATPKKPAATPKQIELEPGVVLKPLSTPIKNGDITVEKIVRTVATELGFNGLQTAAQVRNKISEQRLKLMNLDKELDPRIKWFNEHCGTD